MKASILIAVAAFASISTAHELDEQKVPASNETTVVRISKADPTKVEVASVNKRLAKGERADNMDFTQLAMKAEPRNVKTARATELDGTSSTNSWRVWGAGGGYYGGNGYGGAYIGYRGVAAVGVGYRGYGGYGNNCYSNNNCYNNCYQSTGCGYYNPYYGSSYYSQPYYQNSYVSSYYGYEDNNYSYQYYNCPRYY